MAAVATVIKTCSLGLTEKIAWGKIALDSSYPTAGEALTVPGMERVDVLLAQPGGAAASGAGYKPEWNESAQKLTMFYGDNNNASDGPAIEVPNTTDLSAITGMPFIAIGS